MRGNEFLDKMELIDPAYIEAADTKLKTKKTVLVKWGAMAACLCLVVVGALMIGQQGAPQPPDSTNLEPITIPELGGESMGFEGYLFHDISELRNGNPWSETVGLTALPVYRNGSYDPTGAGFPIGLSETEMRERLDHVASSLGLEVLSTEASTDGFTLVDGEMVPLTEPTAIYADTTEGEINIYADGGIDYWLPDEGLALPDVYSLTDHDTTDEEAEIILSYLTNAYSELLGFAEPKAVSFGDYNIYGELQRRYMAYDVSGDDVEDIINYNFRCVSFAPNDEGNLWLIRIKDGLLSAEKLGDYPIITTTEATERLTAGYYQTSVPDVFPGEEYIGKVELVYRTGRFEEMFLPYYRFYVLLPEEAMANTSATENGLVTYGAYYVPAIADEYIANMPTNDGRFNY